MRDNDNNYDNTPPVNERNFTGTMKSVNLETSENDAAGFEVPPARGLAIVTRKDKRKGVGAETFEDKLQRMIHEKMKGMKRIDT